MVRSAHPGESMSKTVGILTGGGDCPGLNAVIRAAVKTAKETYGYRVIGIERAFEGMMEPATRELDLESIKGILPKGGTILGTTNKGDPFNFPLGDERHDMSHRIMENFRALELDALIVIGGDGSLTIGNRFSELGLPIVAVPKTIDNDLEATDFTFGFMSAVSVATEAVDRLHSTAESHGRVMILEVMGRNAGWIALYSGIAGGADIILLPEIPHDPRSVVRGIEERFEKGSLFGIIVVAEGAKPKGGMETFVDRRSRRLGGVAYEVADDLRRSIDAEVRVTVLGHVQRGGSPIAFDRLLATRFGSKAMDLVHDGDFGKMVALRGDSIVSVPLRDAVASPKLVDPDSEIVRTAKSLGTSFGDE